MELIADSDGVDIILAPIEDEGFMVNLDFNTPKLALYELDNRMKDWDLHVRSGRKIIGRAKFSAFQFIADGVERRTISLKYLELTPSNRGERKSYDMAQFIIDTVTNECDRDWNPVNGTPVLFVEKKDLDDLPEDERTTAFSFLKHLVERLFGLEPSKQPISDHDLVVTVVGDDVSMQLIEGHLVRSARAARRLA